MSKALDLAKKLHALATRGVPGEREAAIAALERHMKKHNITLDEIEGEERSVWEFIVKKDQTTFFYQIVGNVVGRDASTYEYTFQPKRGHVRKGVECTAAQKIEIEAKFEFYWEKFKQDQKLLYEGFIHKNQLGVKPSPDKASGEELTPEELARLFKISEMMKGLERHNIVKRLNPHNS